MWHFIYWWGKKNTVLLLRRKINQLRRFKEFYLFIYHLNTYEHEVNKTGYYGPGASHLQINCQLITMYFYLSITIFFFFRTLLLTVQLTLAYLPLCLLIFLSSHFLSNFSSTDNGPLHSDSALRFFPQGSFS